MSVDDCVVGAGVQHEEQHTQQRKLDRGFLIEPKPHLFSNSVAEPLLVWMLSRAPLVRNTHSRGSCCATYTISWREREIERERERSKRGKV